MGDGRFFAGACVCSPPVGCAIGRNLRVDWKPRSRIDVFLKMVVLQICSLVIPGSLRRVRVERSLQIFQQLTTVVLPRFHMRRSKVLQWKLHMPRLILPLQIGILASALCAFLTRLKDVMQLSKPPYSDRHRLIGQQNNADKGRRGSTAWSSTSLQLLTSSRQAPALHSRHCLTRHAERASTSKLPSNSEVRPRFSLIAAEHRMTLQG